MLTQLQLEGPELEPLLARVRHELGSSARIVHAEKIRSGGVAGFFARERFELTVEVDTEAHRAFTAAQAAAAASRTAAATVTTHPDSGVAPRAAERRPEPAERTAAALGAAATAPVPAAVPSPSGTPASGSAPSRPVVSAPAQAVPVQSVPVAGVPAAHSVDEHPVASVVPEPDDSLFSTIIGLGAAEGTGRAGATAGDERFSALLTGTAPSRTAPSSSVLRGAAATAAASAYRPVGEVVLNPAAAVLAAEEAAASTPPASPATGAPTADEPAGAAPSAPRTLLELAAQASSDEQAATVSTESPSFASLLDGLSDAIGIDRTAGIEGSSGVPSLTVPEQRVDGGDTAVAAAAPGTGVPLTDSEGLRVAGGVSEDLRVPGPVVEGPVVEGRVVSAGGGACPPPADSAAAAVAVAVRPATEAAPLPGGAVEQDDPTSAELARLGLPRHLRPATVGQQLHTALRASLTRLPTAPPAINRAGGVLAIVGPLSLALHVAREIAEELGLPAATSVAVATSGSGATDVPQRQVLHGAAEAADRRATWRRRSNLTVVAVDAPLTATGAAEARAFLAALSPSATWGAVEATRKAQDVATWTRALGGVHALALTDVEDTADPAAVLELGIPVSRLGGRPATPRAWATLLTGRLAA